VTSISSSQLHFHGVVKKRCELNTFNIKEMAETNTIRVPRPIAYEEGGPMNTAFVVFEFPDIGGGGGSSCNLGVQTHGWTIGSTFGIRIDSGMNICSS
jgi:fructosamine-3-kinase